MQYFEEAIKYNDHCFQLYNLAHLYFYEKPIENSNQESIKLLIKSLKYDHYSSKILLCIVSITEFGNDINRIIKELSKFENFSAKLAILICDIIRYYKLNQPSILKEKYDQYRHINYIFDFDFFADILSMVYDFLKIETEITETNRAESIDSNF